ncbi:FAM151B isoform X1 [Pelobates cultripes]|uniref:FAM151B isoform X1 n=1 Tax=Pelobates cultripes TaxID=61616 RepID=A0AAD1SBS3_PELCU|nr:FAM151B isoform X1 [Pelobates cultripes]
MVRLRSCSRCSLPVLGIVSLAVGVLVLLLLISVDLEGRAMEGTQGSWSENILDYFLGEKLIKKKDGSEITWYHAANSKAKLEEALQSDINMIEADVILRGSGNKEPIMAHPPETDSDITLQQWLDGVSSTKKGIKIDFKSLESVLPSMQILQALKPKIKQPVWINADILQGPGGKAKPVDSKEFIDTVTSFFADVTLSLGWTTNWYPDKHNEGYSWEMVREMEEICKALSQPVTFPVRAALVRQSWDQLHWLLKKSDRYSLTIWAGKDDFYSVDDLLYVRRNSDKSSIYYDVFEPQNSDFKRAIALGETEQEQTITN